MARQQIFRGNPEQKQSVLFDNFSGGINTSAIDEQVLTNEFRKLVNIELKEQGKIQNRKGFGNVKIINRFFPTLFNENYTYYHIDILHDKDNLFHTLKDYDHIVDEDRNELNTWDDVKELLPPFSVSFEMIYRVGNNVNYEIRNINNIPDFPTHVWKFDKIETGLFDPSALNYDEDLGDPSEESTAKRLVEEIREGFWEKLQSDPGSYDYEIDLNVGFPTVFEADKTLKRTLQGDGYYWSELGGDPSKPYDFDIDNTDPFPEITSQGKKLRVLMEPEYKLNFYGTSQGSNVVTANVVDTIDNYSGSVTKDTFVRVTINQYPSCGQEPGTINPNPAVGYKCVWNDTLFQHAGNGLWMATGSSGASHLYYSAIIDEQLSEYNYYESLSGTSGVVEYYKSVISSTEYKYEYFNSKKISDVVIQDELITGGGKFKKPKLTGIDVLPYDSKRYILLNQIEENNETIVEIDIVDSVIENDENIVSKITRENSYRPNSLETGTIGFNTFSNDPITHVSRYETAEERITSISLHPYGNSLATINKIPKSGNFRLHAYYTGVSDLFNILKLTFHVRDLYGETTEKKAIIKKVFAESSHGFIVFDVLNLAVQENENIVIKLSSADEDGADELVADIEFDTTAEMLNHYRNYENSNKQYLIESVSGGIVNVMRGVEGKEYDYSYDVNFWSLIDEPPSGVIKKEIHEGLGILHDPTVKKLNPDILLTEKLKDSLKEYLKDDYIYVLYDSDNYKLSAYRILKNSSGDVTRLVAWTPIITTIEFKNNVNENVNDYIVSKDRLIKITPDSFYRYNDKLTGTISDFDEMNDVIELDDPLEFYGEYLVGTSVESRIAKVDFRNARGIIIQDRLVLFGGNTIMFSEPYNTFEDSLRNKQSFSYFSSNGWVVLPLHAGDAIQKIAYYRGSYIIFTKEMIYRMSGVIAGEDFEIKLINGEMGCSSPDSVRSINNTLIFLTKNGLHVLKQNYYMDGLENVGKVDRLLSNEIPYGENYESVLYNEQYLLFIKDKEGNYVKTIKQYYNMENFSKQAPYSVDIYREDPEILFKSGISMLSVNKGELYLYDHNYTDFMPHNSGFAPESTETIDDFTYLFEVETPFWSFGYPLHEKKFKNIFVRVDSAGRMPIDFSIVVDSKTALTAKTFRVTYNEFGEVEYELIYDPTLETLPIYTFLTTTGELGEEILGEDALGKYPYQIHKINPAEKGKVINFGFRQKTPRMFSVESIGIVYKLGKMRETR